MAIIKCKMCGGDLNLIEGASTAECEYCGSLQTVPKADDEKKLTLFARANRLRAACEFDKAAGIYESIVADFPEEPEAYWGLVLCNYGIEYVDDPATGKKIPTCHRSSFESILRSSDFQQAQENADVNARKVMREEAKRIEKLREDILAVSGNEQPYDIFICYKETGFDGKRSLDSVLAQDIYDALTDKGYRVFFSRISLEDKLGTEYEPYIFAALNSARIMLVVGTDYEHFNAVWVKNEWSRYLKLMAKDKEKHLIPCYKGIDAYDMPEEFARLQAQDLDKMGAIQDIVRGAEKLLPRQAETGKETVVVQQTAANPTVDSYLKRAFMFLEDGDWNSANEYCEKVLDVDPECPRAYLGKLLAEMQLTDLERLQHSGENFWERSLYQKITRFADPTLMAQLEQMAEFIQRSEIDRKTYEEAIAMTQIQNQDRELWRIYGIKKRKEPTEEDYLTAAQMLETIPMFRDAAQKAQQFRQLAKDQKLEEVYREATTQSHLVSEEAQKKAIALFETIPDYKESRERIAACRRKVEEMEEGKRLRLQWGYRQSGLCQHCGGEFKGLFSKVCTQCGKPKDY